MTRSASVNQSRPRGVREHELKCWLPYFQHVDQGIKTFEVRKADRDYRVGDILYLREWDQAREGYTGRFCERRVSYVLPGGHFGIERDHVVMGLQRV